MTSQDHSPKLLYDEWHRALSRSEEGRETEEGLSSWHEDAFRAAPPLDGHEVVEIGCGRGQFSRFLARYARQVTGVDFSEAAIRIAREKNECLAGTPAPLFLVGSADALPFPAHHFDTLFSCECLEHLPAPKQALREFARVLKPGGHLILTTENYSNGMLIAWARAWFSGRPFNSGAGIQPIEQFFVFWRVKRWLRQAGFDHIRLTGHHFVFFLAPGTHPHRFVRERFEHPFLQRLFLPLARHICFSAVKP